MSRKTKPEGAEVAPTQVEPRAWGEPGKIACRRCRGTGVDPGTTAPPEAKVSPRTCPHPVTRRIGENCAVCGTKVGAPDRRFGR